MKVWVLVNRKCPEMSYFTNKILSLSFLCLFLLRASAQEKENMKYSGGMFLHSGYIENSRQNQKISGFCYGIGGQISFHLSSHFRIGTEGYASNYHYSSGNGYYKLGWGGILFGYEVGDFKWQPVANVTIGGGKVSDLYILNGNIDDAASDEVVYRIYSDMLIAPAVQLEYPLSSLTKLTMKVDYIIPLFSDHYIDYAYGPRLYLGVLFSRD